ncbi:methyltransferase domain-containing protein [Algicola sagamiensis]|uniref:methyltransferase domain-containing protein n=1 Tax=Algicola sagamiensis TaxID=163869 RepID=UPI00036B93D5|nr:methyltransferase domain-containing protein [Algicola sagamiensis]
MYEDQPCKQNQGISSTDFSSTMLQMMNQGMLCLAVNLGHRTGLFEAMSGMKPATCDAISQNAGLNTRYVREWLGAMVTGGIVHYQSEQGLYSLPDEHASVLTPQAGANNMARMTQALQSLAMVSKDVEACFHKGGGVSYDAYPEFMDLWSQVNAQRLDSTLIQKVIPQIPELAAALDRGIDVLDIGCGDGHALCLLAKSFPSSRFKGIDLVASNIQKATKKVGTLQLTNLSFEQCDLTSTQPRGNYHLITAFDVLHDLADPDDVMAALNSILDRDGALLIVDIAASSALEENLQHPAGPWLYTSSCMHCVPVSMAQNGVGLGAMWGREQAVELLEKNGFSDIQVMSVEEDPFNHYFVAKKV